MKEIADGLRWWVEVEDRLVPRLQMSLVERAVYAHLLRHTRVVGKLRLHCSMPWLARGTRISPGAVREGVRNLAHKRALRIVERSNSGHVIEVLSPDEIPGCQGREAGPGAFNLEKADFFARRDLRRAIYERDAHRCFYCRRRVRARTRVLDHVVPRAKHGRNSYRNLATCCAECNSKKRNKEAAQWLRKLYRDGRLSGEELAERFRALKALAQGKLKPSVAVTGLPRRP